MKTKEEILGNNHFFVDRHTISIHEINFDIFGKQMIYNALFLGSIMKIFYNKIRRAYRSFKEATFVGICMIVSMVKL